MTGRTPHPRSRRTAADREPEQTVEALRARVERCHMLLLNSMGFVCNWKPNQIDLARLRVLRGDLRNADLEAEMLIEAIERLRKREARG